MALNVGGEEQNLVDPVKRLELLRYMVHAQLVSILRTYDQLDYPEQLGLAPAGRTGKNQKGLGGISPK